MAVPPEFFLHCHGTSLAVLLSSAQEGCEAILFGQVRDKEKKVIRDVNESGAVLVQEKHMHITGFHCTATPMAFYDEAGEVQGERLADTLPTHDDPIVGWLSARRSPGPGLQPSMREAAATVSLQRNLADKAGPPSTPPPVLLALLSKHTDHHGSTQGLQYKFFLLPEQRQSTSQAQQAPPLRPVELRITNLARAHSHRTYDTFEPALASAVTPTPEASAALTSLAEAANKQVQQVTSLEEYTQGLLRQLALSCKKASETRQITSLKRENEELSRQLGS